MRSLWKEQREGPLKLSEHDPAIFHKYLQWLYKNNLELRERYEGDDQYPAIYLESMTLAQTLIIGRCFDGRRFRNRCSERSFQFGL